MRYLGPKVSEALNATPHSRRVCTGWGHISRSQPFVPCAGMCIRECIAAAPTDTSTLRGSTEGTPHARARGELATVLAFATSSVLPMWGSDSDADGSLTTAPSHLTILHAAIALQARLDSSFVACEGAVIKLCTSGPSRAL